MKNLTVAVLPMFLPIDHFVYRMADMVKSVLFIIIDIAKV